MLYIIAIEARHYLTIRTFYFNLIISFSIFEDIDLSREFDERTIMSFINAIDYLIEKLNLIERAPRRELSFALHAYV